MDKQISKMLVCHHVTYNAVQDFPNLESEYRGQSFKMTAAWHVHNSSEGPHMGPGSAERQSSFSLGEIVGHDACVVVRGVSDIFSVVMVYTCVASAHKGPRLCVQSRGWH